MTSESASIRLYLGDCLEVMPTLADRSVDMILADLPYGTTACSWDTVIPFEPLWAQYKRLIKPRGAIVLFGSQPFTTLLIQSNLEWFKYCWVWSKSMGSMFQHAKNMPLKAHEDIAVFSDGVINHSSMTDNRMAYYPQMGMGTRYSKKQVSVNVRGHSMHHASKANLAFIGTTTKSEGKRYPTTVIECSNGNHNLSHPMQKPTTLLSYLILTYTNKGETVLDNTMGSGSTMVACINTDRNGIGIELDEAYYQIAQKRVTEAQAQLRLDI